MLGVPLYNVSRVRERFSRGLIGDVDLRQSGRLFVTSRFSLTISRGKHTEEIYAKTCATDDVNYFSLQFNEDIIIYENDLKSSQFFLLNPRTEYGGCIALGDVYKLKRSLFRLNEFV